MKSKYLLGLLACLCASANAQLVPTYSQHYIESLNAEVDPTAFELVDTNSLTEPFDKYATDIQYNGLYLLTFNSSKQLATLFKKSSGKWFFKTEIDLLSLLNDDLGEVTGFSANTIHLNADGSIYASFRYFDATEDSWFTDTGRFNYDGSSYASFESFVLSANLNFDQIAVDGDILLLRDSSQLYVYQLGQEAALLGTFNLRNDVNSFEQLEFVPESNRILVTGHPSENSENQAIFIEYEYSIGDQALTLEIRNAIERDEQYYRERARIVLGENQKDYVIISNQSSYAYRYRYSDENNEYSALRSVDASDFGGHPYYGFNNRLFYSNGKLFSYRNSRVHSFDLQSSAGAELELSLGDYHTNYGSLVGITNSQYIFASSRLFTTTYSRTDGSETKLVSGAELFYFSKISDLGDSAIIAVGNGNVSVLSLENDSMEVRFKEELESLGGYYYAAELVGNTLYMYYQSLVTEIEFTQLADGSIEHSINSFPILDLDNGLYDSRYSQVRIDSALGHTLVNDYQGLKKLEKNGQVYQVTRAFLNDDEAFDSIVNLETAKLTESHLFVVDGHRETFSIFDVAGSDPVLLSQVYDPAIFSYGSDINVDGNTINIVGSSLYTTFSMDDEFNLQLEVVTPFSGTWLDTGRHYSMELDRFDNINLRQKDTNTGFYRLLSTNDVSLQDPVLLTTETKGVIVGRVGGSGYSTSPISVNVFDYQRAPIGLQDEYSIVENQGESVSVDLTSLFAEDDSDDVLDFSSDVSLSAIGLKINGNMLESSNSEYFDSEAFAIYATDKNGKSASVDMTTSINRRPQLIQPLPEVSQQNDEQSSVNLNNYFYDDQDQSISFALRGDDIDGVSLDENGVLSIAITTAGSYSVGIDVTDNLGAVNQATLSVTITAPAAAQTTSTTTTTTEAAPTVSAPNNSGSSGGSTGPALIAMLIGLAYLRRRKSLS